jgi:hypothetical protein
MKTVLLLLLAGCGPAFTIAEPDASPPRETSIETGGVDVVAVIQYQTGDAASAPDVAIDAPALDVEPKEEAAPTLADTAPIGCDLSCEASCVRLAVPMHACCTSAGCGCLSDAGVCAY